VTEFLNAILTNLFFVTLLVCSKYGQGTLMYFKHSVDKKTIITKK